MYSIFCRKAVNACIKHTIPLAGSGQGAGRGKGSQNRIKGRTETVTPFGDVTPGDIIFDNPLNLMNYFIYSLTEYFTISLMKIQGVR